jgi:hypothetical protein
MSGVMPALESAGMLSDAASDGEYSIKPDASHRPGAMKTT